MSLGAVVAFNSAKKDSKEVKAAQNWQEHTVLYAHATSYTDLYCRVKRGDDVGWESHSMTKTSYKYGNKYVYTGQIWECYGGLNNMYMKSGNISGDQGTLVQTIFETWTETSTWADKLYDGSSWQTVYKVDFDMNGHGTAPSGQYVASGGKVSQPTAPTASGYIFGGWYKEAGCTNAWNFSSDTVSSNKTLYAKWTAQIVQYTVSKYKVLDNASPVLIGSEQVNAGTNYPVPANRYEAGYTFGGWYTNTQCTTSYTARAINVNTNLYAKYTSGTWSGTVNLDLRDTFYSEAAANYAIYFMDKTTYPEEIGAWSSYTTGTKAGEKLVSVSYNIPFNPQKMTIVRYDSAYSQATWNSDKWCESHASSKWGQTVDTDFSTMVRIGTDTEDGKNKAYCGYPRVMGGTGGAWANIIELTSLKMNDSSKAVEYYSTSVTLASGTSFKIFEAPYNDTYDYHSNYSAHSSIESNFSGGAGSNITVTTGGTFAFYFNGDTGSLYITTVAAATADEWSQYFLANVGCDATGRTEPTGWSTCATEYAKLSGDAKDIVYKAEADENGDFVQKAVARYDAALRSHPSLSHFIVDSSDKPRGGAYETPYVVINNSNSGVIIGVSVVAIISISAIGGYFFLRKKKEN